MSVTKGSAQTNVNILAHPQSGVPEGFGEMEFAPPQPSCPPPLLLPQGKTETSPGG